MGISSDAVQVGVWRKSDFVNKTFALKNGCPKKAAIFLYLV